MTSASQTHVPLTVHPASKVTGAGVKSQPFFVKTVFVKLFKEQTKCLNFPMTYS
jgi:hypothetical protein